MMNCCARIHNATTLDGSMWAGAARWEPRSCNGHARTSSLTTSPPRQRVRHYEATVDAFVPWTCQIELDDGGVLHGGPAWPEWIDLPIGPPPMWVADDVLEQEVAHFVSLFPSTGLWPLRLLHQECERWALIPAHRPADVPARLQWGVPGRGRHTGVALSSLLASWEDRCGAVLVALGADQAVVDPHYGDGSTWVLNWGDDPDTPFV